MTRLDPPTRVPTMIPAFTRVAIAAILALVSPAVARAADAPRPNILFIMSDDHAYQAISAYGGKLNQTPNIDRIAKEGVRFDRCFVTNSICGPARAVILTGKYSHLNGFYENNTSRFYGGQQHVGKLLQAAGYQTAVFGKWHLVTNPTGFDDYAILQGQGPYYNPGLITPGGVVKHTGYTTDIITDVTLDWLEKKRDPKKPFFAMYQHKAPHRNWQPSPKYLHKYDDVTIPEPATLFDDYKNRTSAAGDQQMEIRRHLSPHDLKLAPQTELNPDQRKPWDEAYAARKAEFEKMAFTPEVRTRWNYQQYMKDYLRCIDSVDEGVGRVLDYLDKSGLAENTIVFYTSDQGFYLGEHGWYDKRWMYEESFRTPLLVRWPGKIKPGGTNRDLVMNLDFAETFLDVAGVQVPADMQGRSLKPILTGQTPADWRKSVYYRYYEFPQPHHVQPHYGVRTDRYKLIYFDKLDAWELFDLDKDPHELKSIYADPEYAKTVEELKAELARLRKQYQDNDEIAKFDDPAAEPPAKKKMGKAGE